MYIFKKVIDSSIYGIRFDADYGGIIIICSLNFIVI